MRTKIIIGVVTIVVIGAGAFAYVRITHKVPPAPTPTLTSSHTTIGSSVEGRAIEAYTYPAKERLGEKHLLFVGGVHGGYEWNSVLLAYELIDYLDAHPESIPENLVVTIIPSLNPDGVFQVFKKEGRFTEADVPKRENTTGLGRFNAHGVDLNRNFDCKWQPKATWKGNNVSAGESVFSEPESRALRNFVAAHRPDAAVFFHSQANAVYASDCTEGILPETLSIMDAYSHAAGYSAEKSFDAYEVTGDAEGWLASEHVPAITVEMSTHDSVEWDKNIAGVKVLFALFGRIN